MGHRLTRKTRIKNLRHLCHPCLFHSLGLADEFDAVFCRDDVEDVGKPDPAVYRAALGGLGIRPSQAIAFEDSLNGVRAAKAARLTCIAVPNEMTRHLDFGEADYQLDSLAAMSLADLLAEIGVGERP